MLVMNVLLLWHLLMFWLTAGTSLNIGGRQQKVMVSHINMANTLSGGGSGAHALKTGGTVTVQGSSGQPTITSVSATTIPIGNRQCSCVLLAHVAAV